MPKKVTGGNILSLQQVCKLYNYSEAEIIELCKKGFPHNAQPGPGGTMRYLFTDSEVAMKLTPKPEIHDLPTPTPSPTPSVRPDRVPSMEEKKEEEPEEKPEEEPEEKPPEKKPEKTTAKKPAAKTGKK